MSEGVAAIMTFRSVAEPKGLANYVDVVSPTRPLKFDEAKFSVAACRIYVSGTVASACGA